MDLLENKQYNFIHTYTLPRQGDKEVDSYIFLYNNFIYITSYTESKPFFKHVFNKETKELINFENYRKDLITCSGKSINKLTEIYSSVTKKFSNVIEKKLEYKLIEDFNLIIQSFMIERKHTGYSFEDHQFRNNGLLENYLYKYINFYSNYQKDFNSNSLNLDLFKNKNEFWYCISTIEGEKLCKFIFEIKDNLNAYMFHLTHRENYIKAACNLDFTVLAEEFKHITWHSEHMYMDIADDKISISSAEKYSYFPIIFNDIQKLSLSI